jgi:hypothetical protein
MVRYISSLTPLGNICIGATDYHRDVTGAIAYLILGSYFFSTIGSGRNARLPVIPRRPKRVLQDGKKKN